MATVSFSQTCSPHTSHCWTAREIRGVLLVWLMEARSSQDPGDPCLSVALTLLSTEGAGFNVSLAVAPHLRPWLCGGRMLDIDLAQELLIHVYDRQAFHSMCHLTCRVEGDKSHS